MNPPASVPPHMSHGGQGGMREVGGWALWEGILPIVGFLAAQTLAAIAIVHWMAPILTAFISSPLPDEYH